MSVQGPFYLKPELEKTVEKESCAYAFKRGWFETKLISLSARGWPDRFYARNGVILLVEYKKDGIPPSTQQLKRHRELREHGVIVHVIDNIEQAYALFE